MNGMISVAIVEDDLVYSAGVQTLLNSTTEFRCVAECPSAENALKRLPALKPDVVLMDIRLPKLNGIECVRQLNTLLPGTEIMMLTTLSDNDYVYQALTAGATGYLIKQGNPTELLEAIRDLHQGGSPMSAAIARKVVLAFKQFNSPAKDTETLSQREREVLDSLAKGHRYKEIALELNPTCDTVRTHIQNISRSCRSVPGRKPLRSTAYPGRERTRRGADHAAVAQTGNLRSDGSYWHASFFKPGRLPVGDIADKLSAPPAVIRLLRKYVYLVLVTCTDKCEKLS
jgi:DNA-binding NarL/FixJ family response regulator